MCTLPLTEFHFVTKKIYKLKFYTSNTGLFYTFRKGGGPQIFSEVMLLS